MDAGNRCGRIGTTTLQSSRNASISDILDSLAALALHAPACAGRINAPIATLSHRLRGRATIVVHDAAALLRYRFPHRTADFFICTRCGIYMGAVCEADGRAWATLDVNTFEAPLDQPVVAVS